MRGLLTIEDLISAGYEGLTKAACNYDPHNGAKFTTYSSMWIKKEMFKEMYFYIGKEALLLDNETEQMQVSVDKSAEDVSLRGPQICEIPQKEQVRIIKEALNKFKLTEDEIKVYLAVNGIGCSKVTNMRALAGQMKKREMDIRRIKQSAENKLKKTLDQ